MGRPLRYPTHHDKSNDKAKVRKMVLPPIVQHISLHIHSLYVATVE